MIHKDCEEDIAAIARDPVASLDAWPPGTPDSDRALMADPVIRARALANKRELVRRGPEGNAHDHLLNCAKPWGFRVAHAPNMEHPEEFNRNVLNFLRSQ